MIRLEHTRLPRGLNALVLPDGDDVVITVAATLPSELKKAAVHVAMAAAKRAGWRRTQLLPPAVWIPLAAAAMWEVMRRLVAEAGPAHAAAAAGAVLTVAAVGVTTLVVLVPAKPGPVTVRQIPPIARTHPRRRAARIATVKRQPKRGKGPAGMPFPLSGSGLVALSTAQPSPSASVSASATVSVPPLPVPTPSSGQSETCIVLLGVPVCL